MGAANIFTGRVLARKEHIVHLETPSGPAGWYVSAPRRYRLGASLSVVVRPDVVQVVPHGWTLDRRQRLSRHSDAPRPIWEK